MRPEGGFGGASFALPQPVVTRAVIALCVVLTAIGSFAGAPTADAIAAHAALIPARVTGALPSRPGDVPALLTLVTSMFLHAGWLHLLVNMTFLAWIGKHVELAVGRLRFALLYLAGGIAGGLVQVAVAPTSVEAVVGASGAIAAVFAAYALLFAQHRARSIRLLGLTIGGEMVTALWYLATWLGLQLLTALAFNTGRGGIAVWTHVGGFALGLVAGQLLVRRLRQAG